MDKINDEGSFSRFANSFQAVTVPGLERIGALCELLGNPQRKLKFVHIAGTNGKGSVCANLSAIAAAAGIKTGKYISPNLIRVNERISIDGVDISDEALMRLLAKIEPLCSEVEKALGTAPTQFEIWCAVAFSYFAEAKCELVILEVGLGGELDATNIIDGNEIAIITRLGLDHTQYLGSTLSEVASAKCGIMKQECRYKTVITTSQESEAMEVINTFAKKLGHTVSVPQPTALGSSGMHEIFALDGETYTCGIAGEHQVENASLAIYAARALGIDIKYIKAGVAAAKNPARFELVCESPTVIYDGGHNENGIEALVRSLQKYFGDTEKTVVFACMADKDIQGSLEMLNRGKTSFIFTEVKNNPRALGAYELKKRAEALGFSGDAYSDIGEAYEAALQKNRLTVICGSLYLYKDLKEYLDGNK